MQNDGGPAFPSGLMPSTNESTPDDLYPMFTGLSIRDWFACQALGHLSQPILAAMHNGCDAPRRDEIAFLCYALADAMLKAREQ